MTDFSFYMIVFVLGYLFLSLSPVLWTYIGEGRKGTRNKTSKKGGNHDSESNSMVRRKRK